MVVLLNHKIATIEKGYQPVYCSKKKEDWRISRYIGLRILNKELYIPVQLQNKIGVRAIGEVFFSFGIFAYTGIISFF